MRNHLLFLVALLLAVTALTARGLDADTDGARRISSRVYAEKLHMVDAPYSRLDVTLRAWEA